VPGIAVDATYVADVAHHEIQCGNLAGQRRMSTHTFYVKLIVAQHALALDATIF
jgi:hypothetical protein